MSLLHSIARHFATAALLGAVAVSFAAGQATARRPNLSGVWILDYAHSDSSSFTPKSATYAVVQAGDSMIVDRESPMVGKTHTVYGLDRKPRKNILRLVGTETEATSTATWQNGSLVIHTTSHPGEIDLVQTDTWTLSADGKGLSIKREAISNGTSMGSPTLRFIKQARP